jgi:hypothetical protein
MTSLRERVLTVCNLRVVRAVEGKHDRRCFDYYFKSQGKQDFVTQVNEGSLVFSHVSEVHPSNHGELSTGARFSTLEQFQAAASAFAEKRYPNYPIYFRARKNDRPEYYCKYQSASTAQTAPGLSCKYGFNAKWRAEESSYVVTKVGSFLDRELRQEVLTLRSSSVFTSIPQSVRSGPPSLVVQGCLPKMSSLEEIAERHVRYSLNGGRGRQPDWIQTRN